jgi:hypothetical protein
MSDTRPDPANGLTVRISHGPLLTLVLTLWLTWWEIGPTYRRTTNKARAHGATGDQGRYELTDERPAEVDGELLCREADIDGYEELTGFVMEDFADVLAEFVNYEGYTQEEAVAFLKRFTTDDKRALTNTLLAASRWREIFADFIRDELDR